LKFFRAPPAPPPPAFRGERTACPPFRNFKLFQFFGLAPPVWAREKNRKIFDQKRFVVFPDNPLTQSKQPTPRHPPRPAPPPPAQNQTPRTNPLMPKRVFSPPPRGKNPNGSPPPRPPVWRRPPPPAPLRSPHKKTSAPPPHPPNGRSSPGETVPSGAPGEARPKSPTRCNPPSRRPPPSGGNGLGPGRKKRGGPPDPRRTRGPAPFPPTRAGPRAKQPPKGASEKKPARPLPNRPGKVPARVFFFNLAGSVRPPPWGGFFFFALARPPGRPPPPPPPPTPPPPPPF